MVTDESAYPEYNEKNEKWEDFTVIAISQGAQRRSIEKYLKAEAGGGGGFGSDRPQAMIVMEGFQS